MGLITVEVWDATGNKKRQVEMPDDAPMQRILAVLIERMSFPQHGPDGQLLSYKCQHRATGKQLLDDQTLGEVGVTDGDVLRLLPEITAGARRPSGPLSRYGRERVRVRAAQGDCGRHRPLLKPADVDVDCSTASDEQSVAGPHPNPLPAIPGVGTSA